MANGDQGEHDGLVCETHGGRGPQLLSKPACNACELFFCVDELYALSAYNMLQMLYSHSVTE